MTTISDWIQKRAGKATGAQLREIAAKARAGISAPTTESIAAVSMLRRDIPTLAEMNGQDILSALAEAADAAATTR